MIFGSIQQITTVSLEFFDHKRSFLSFFNRDFSLTDIFQLFIAVQNILRKIKKSRKVTQNWKTLIPAFSYILRAGSTKSLFLKRD